MKMHQNHRGTDPASCKEIPRYISFKECIFGLHWTDLRILLYRSAFSCLKWMTTWKASTTENDSLTHCCKFYLDLSTESHNTNRAKEQIPFSRLCATRQSSREWLSAPLTSHKGAFLVKQLYVSAQTIQKRKGLKHDLQHRILIALTLPAWTLSVLVLACFVHPVLKVATFFLWGSTVLYSTQMRKDQEYFKATMENVGSENAKFASGQTSKLLVLLFIFRPFAFREATLLQVPGLKKTLQRRNSPSSLPLIGWRFCALSSLVLNSCRRTLCWKLITRIHIMARINIRV